MSKNKMSKQEIISAIMVVMVISSVAIETDIFVPSFPAILDYFDTTEFLTQMIIGVNFIGLCVSGIFYGPLSDTYGRRNIMLIGMGIFLLASIGCILAESIEALLFWRFVQGLGASAGFVIPGTIIFDIFDKERAAKVLGLFNSAIAISIAGAPILGSYLYLKFGWQANFIFVAAFALISFLLVLLFFEESLPKHKRQKFDVTEIYNNFIKVSTNKISILNLIIICGVFAAYLVYIINLSLVFVEGLGVNETVYAWYQGIVIASFAATSLIVSSFITRIGLDYTYYAGNVILLIGASILLLVAFLQPTNPIMITASMCIFAVGFALMINITFGNFMNIYPEIKGVAASFCTAVRLLIVSFVVAIVGSMYNGTILPVAIAVIICTMIAFISFLKVVKLEIPK